MLHCLIIIFFLNLSQTRQETQSQTQSISVCYVAERTIVLSRHGCYRTTLWIFLGSRRMETAPTSIVALMIEGLLRK